MMRAADLRRLLNFSSLHGYVYGTWTKQYLHVLNSFIVPYLSRGGKAWLADRYHGKVLRPELTEAKGVPLDVRLLVREKAAR